MQQANDSAFTSPQNSALMQDRALMRMLLDRAPVGFAFIDREFRFVLVNEPLAEINGRPVDDHIGRHVSEVVPDMASENVALFEQVVETRQPVLGIELRGSTDAMPGKLRDWLVNYYPIEDDGVVIGVGLTVVEVTEQKRSEHELREALKERDQISRTLQRSLLPPDLPRIPGLEIAARYFPLGSGSEVGGDFYDVFQSGSDRWHMIMGDICGKGPEAASLIGLIRHTVRAAALHEDDPSETLRLVNQAILKDDRERFATLAYVRLSSGGDRCVVALGGHPRPILVRDGSAEPIGVHGTALGMFEDIDVTPSSVALRPGDQLFVYTDGLTDYAGSMVDDAVIADALLGCSGSEADKTAKCIEEKLVDDREHFDDIAFVVVNVL